MVLDEFLSAVCFCHVAVSNTKPEPNPGPLGSILQISISARLSQLAVWAEQSRVSPNMQGEGEPIVQDNYLSGRRNRVNSRWRGSGSWVRRWKAGGRRRRLSMRQAFREEFILHRTETEESGYPQDRHSMLAGVQPYLRMRGGEGTSRPASQDHGEASHWSPAGLSGSGYIFCSNSPVTL